MKIQSIFTFETGRYDKESNLFVDRKSSPEPRELEIIKEIRNDKEVLVFIGGPTGFESYYIEDLKKNISVKSGDFCICGGTINSWPRCIVKVEDILDFIKEE